MEKEISNGAMLGIVLIALAAIIGLGFGVFAIAKGTANEGVTGVQENLGAVGNSAFTDYDQKIVTGTQVVSALQNFEGKSVAVLISTQSLKDRSTVAPTRTDIVAGAGVDSAYKTKHVPIVLGKEMASTGSGVGTAAFNTTDSSGSTVPLVFVNYNALLANASLVANNTEGIIGFDSNCWRTANGFNATGGKVQMNGITGNLSKSGMMEYVPSGSRFQSYLIKDLSGTIMGVAFEQLNSK